MAISTPAAPPRTPLLDAITKSGLVTADRLAEVLSQFDPAQIAGADPIQLATYLVRKKLLTKFQAMQLLNGRTQGFILGRYRILDGLRQDRVGMVFLAEHLDTGATAAVKVLPTDKVADPKSYQAFLQEAKAAAVVNHPNVARVFDAGIVNGTHYVAVEHVSAPTLDKVVAENGPLPPHTAAQVVAQVSLGLMHAHDKGIIHRDLKPANIALLPDSRVKLLDLGLTRMIDNPYAGHTQRHNMKEYAEEVAHVAPEQAIGDELDARSDVYSLGSTLYYLLTGRSPFPGLAIKAMTDKQLWDLPLPSAVAPEVPPEIDDLIARMGTRDPNTRFQSAEELVVALRQWLPLSDWVALGFKPQKPAARPASGVRPAVKPPGSRPRIRPDEVVEVTEPAPKRGVFGAVGAFFGRLFGR